MYRFIFFNKYLFISFIVVFYLCNSVIIEVGIDVEGINNYIFIVFCLLIDFVIGRCFLLSSVVVMIESVLFYVVGCLVNDLCLFYRI